MGIVVCTLNQAQYEDLRRSVCPWGWLCWCWSHWCWLCRSCPSCCHRWSLCCCSCCHCCRCPRRHCCCCPCCCLPCCPCCRLPCCPCCCPRPPSEPSCWDGPGWQAGRNPGS